MSGSPFHKKKSRIKIQMIVMLSRESPPRDFINSFSENLSTNYMYNIYMYNYLSIYGVKL